VLVKICVQVNLSYKCMKRASRIQGVIASTNQNAPFGVTWIKGATNAGNQLRIAPIHLPGNRGAIWQPPVQS
jgi:hypothetical protein